MIVPVTKVYLYCIQYFTFTLSEEAVCLLVKHITH